MINILMYVIVFIAGGLTALIYLWLLHLSVKRIVRNTAVSWFAFFGFLFRLLICGICFFLSSLGGHLDRLAVSVIGFTIVRILAVIMIKSFPKLPGVRVEVRNDDKS